MPDIQNSTYVINTEGLRVGLPEVQWLCGWGDKGSVPIVGDDIKPPKSNVGMSVTLGATL